jgi:hypothetical protein
MTDRKTIWHYATYIDLEYQTLEQVKVFIEDLIRKFGKDARIFKEEEDDYTHFELRIPKLESDADYEIRKRSEAAQQAKMDQYDREAYERLKAKFG